MTGRWKSFLTLIVNTCGRVLIIFIIGSAAAQTGSFDKPLHKRVLNLGRSPELMPADHRPVTITCWYYTHFMVKEHNDPGSKGAVSISLVPGKPGHLPKCAQAQQPGEKAFRVWSAEFKAFYGWDGYFAGVKRNLVFLEGSDGDSNGGIPFGAFEPNTLNKVLEDSVTLLKPGERDLTFINVPGNQITIRYWRVVSASCSIPKSGESCWSKLKQQTGLTHSPMPKCSDYEGTYAGTADSVIAYRVEVSLFPTPSTRPLGGPVRCYAAP